MGIIATQPFTLLSLSYILDDVKEDGVGIVVRFHFTNFHIKINIAFKIIHISCYKRPSIAKETMYSLVYLRIK